MQAHHEATTRLPATDALPLPRLEREACVQHIRCGKTGAARPAAAARGHLHGPYRYRSRREGAQVRKVYVKAAEPAAARAACEAHKTLSRNLRDVKQTRTRLTQSILKEWRRTQRYIGK